MEIILKYRSNGHIAKYHILVKSIIVDHWCANRWVFSFTLHCDSPEQALEYVQSQRQYAFEITPQMLPKTLTH